MSDTKPNRIVDPDGYYGALKIQLDEALEGVRLREGYILTLEKRLDAQSALIQQLQKDKDALQSPDKPDQPAA